MKLLTNASVAMLSLVLLAGEAAAQSTKSAKDEIVGAWTFVSVDGVRPDGTRSPAFGPKPHGLVIFTADERYSVQVYNPDRPKLKNRLEGSPEENKALVHGSNLHFGRYTINEADKTITFKIEGAFFPPWEGTEQKRSYTLDGDELKYFVPVSTSGGAGSEVVLRRAK